MKTLIISSAVSAVFVVLPVVALADTVNVNFESPTYSLGTINAQDGWSSLGAAGSGCAVYDHAVDGSLGTAGFGSQSLRISNSVVSGCFGDQTFSKSLANEAGETAAINSGLSGGTRQSHFEAQFALASTVPGSEQSGLYMSVSPDRGDGARMSYLRFEDQPDGIHVFFDDYVAHDFREVDIATLTRTPHAIKFVMDFVDGAGNDVVKIYIDGVLKTIGTSWEDYFRNNQPLIAPPTVDSLLFRTGGSTNNSGVAGHGFLVDNLTVSSGPILTPPPTNKDQCKKDGWKAFNNPAFKNQGDCVSFVVSQKVLVAGGDITMGSPSQRMIFSAFDYKNNASLDTGTVEYWNYEYPGILHYTAAVQCVFIDPLTKVARFMFQIPAGWPGLSDLYVVSAVKDNGLPGTNDTYGHAATSDPTTALSWCNDGGTFTSYPITGGNLIVNE